MIEITVPSLNKNPAKCPFIKEIKNDLIINKT
jgi:hypothetical protein